MANEQTPIASDQAAPSTQLVLQGVYLKDCSFEAPQGPRSNGEWNPQISLDLNTNVLPIGGDMREVVLTVTVSAKQGEQTLFLVEVKQAGAFVMQGLAGEDLKRAVGPLVLLNRRGPVALDAGNEQHCEHALAAGKERLTHTRSI